ncbi:MAG: DUF427 domain-containing protein [Betaproteobacteria bacterium]|nr:DUF427 domain-containing protein [Betaproteobacteria bacterium]
MIKAMWNNTIIAQTSDYETVDGNKYFPPGTLDMRYFRLSETHTNCHWKGDASYYDIVVDGQVNKDGAWFYPVTEPAAKNITGYVAFWNGVKIVETADA